MENEIFVYADLDGSSTLVGRLWTRVRGKRESASFEYDSSWLKRPDRFALEPALELGEGAFHTRSDKPLFGAIGDSAPDRWGASFDAAGRTPPSKRCWRNGAISLGI